MIVEGILWCGTLSCCCCCGSLRFFLVSVRFFLLIHVQMIRGYAKDLFLNMIIVVIKTILSSEMLHDIIRKLDTDVAAILVLPPLSWSWVSFVERHLLRRQSLLLLILPPGTVDPEGAQVLGWLPVGVCGELWIILKPPIRLVIFIITSYHTMILTQPMVLEYLCYITFFKI